MSSFRPLAVRLALAIVSAASAVTGPAAATAVPAPDPHLPQPQGAAAPELIPGVVSGRLPSLARDAYPASASISTDSAYQGGAVRLIVFEAQAATSTFLGKTVELPVVSGRLSTYLGIPTDAALGPAPLIVEAIDSAGEAVSIELTVIVLETNWTVDYIVLPPGVGSGLTPEIIRAEAERLAAIYSEVSAVVWDAPWVWPVDKGTRVSGYFGEQRSFNGGPPSGHHGGTDFAAAADDPVRVTNGGVVVLAEELAVRGRTVIVDHGGGVHSAYSHLETILVTEGDTVGRGELIGEVGTTGLSTGPHLHWELAVHGVLVDGLRWLDGTQGF